MLSADSLRFYQDSMAEEVYFILTLNKNAEGFLSNAENVLFPLLRLQPWKEKSI